MLPLELDTYLKVVKSKGEGPPDKEGASSMIWFSNGNLIIKLLLSQGNAYD